NSNLSNYAKWSGDDQRERCHTTDVVSLSGCKSHSLQFSSRCRLCSLLECRERERERDAAHSGISASREREGNQTNCLHAVKHHNPHLSFPSPACVCVIQQ